jgi:hypothetical protein
MTAGLAVLALPKAPQVVEKSWTNAEASVVRKAPGVVIVV